ncbi:MAG: tyrosine-type recombinase/integrase [Verrucomicrobiota bacterium]
MGHNENTEGSVQDFALHQSPNGHPQLAGHRQAAETIKKGRSVPYVALCMFGGLRPTEAARLTWDQVNLKDGEIRLKGVQTKTGKGRIVVIDKTLKAWLSQYRKRGEIYRSAYEKDLRQGRVSIGYQWLSMQPR